jgi:DASS family divalent anion:Na+ symporter
MPDGITPASWRLLAIFLATIVGSIVRPIPGSAMVLLGVILVMLTKSMPLSEAAIRVVSPDALKPNVKAIETLRLKTALGGYADPVVWLVLAAFFMSRAMIKTADAASRCCSFARSDNARWGWVIRSSPPIFCSLRSYLPTAHAAAASPSPSPKA